MSYFHTSGFYDPRIRPMLLRGEEPEWLKKHPRRSYVRAVILSMIPGADQEAIKRLHEWKRFLTICTGVEYVVDHIIPLNHSRACGLTVPANLRVITRAQNAAKGNNWNPDQLELPF